MSVSVKLESCPRCRATKMENLVRVESGQPVKVFLRCAACQTFVARYTLEHYTSDKPYESLLHSIQGQGCFIASRERAQELEAFSKEVEREFLETVSIPSTNLRVEEMIVEGKTQDD